jgi:hypothetical protein
METIKELNRMISQYHYAFQKSIIEEWCNCEDDCTCPSPIKEIGEAINEFSEIYAFENNMDSTLKKINKFGNVLAAYRDFIEKNKSVFAKSYQILFTNIVKKAISLKNHYQSVDKYFD